MNIPEAKFILGAYRPDGSDATSPMFAEALALARRDPELGAWLGRQSEFDRVVAAKVHGVAPPAGLRDAILAGGRASRPRRGWWLHPLTLAAAAFVVLGVLSYSLRPTLSRPAISELVGFALNDLANSHAEHEGFPPELAGLQTQLASAGLPLSRGIDVDLADLRRKHCRAIRFGGREVFEVCFNRDGVWYHLYAAQRSDFASGAADARTLLTSRVGYAATAWVDARNVYALVVHEAPAVLQRLL